MPSAKDLRNLAIRVEISTGEDCELERDITKALVLPWDYSREWPRDEPQGRPYTTSIDAAVELAPNGMAVMLTIDGRNCTAFIGTEKGHSKSEARARTAAALRALAATIERKGS
jgi:hypothetical protein